MNITTFHMDHMGSTATITATYDHPFEVFDVEREGDETLLNLFDDCLNELPYGYYIGPSNLNNIESYDKALYACARKVSMLHTETVGMVNVSDYVTMSDDPNAVY